jgi:putative membrane protein insertion efficiency factor
VKPARLTANTSANSSAPPHAKAKTFGAWWLLAFVRFYKIFFSPFLGGACKFYPSCSNYAQEAIELHGARRGALLALKRLGRCRPFTKGGFDPVPDAEDLDASWLRSDVPFVGTMQGKERAQ